MSEPAPPLPDDVRTILVTRLDALGDVVLGTMLLSGLRARWPGATVRLVVRPQMEGVRGVLPDDVEVVPLPLDPREPVAERTAEIAAQLRAFAGDHRADLVVLGEYNRVWAGEILASLCGPRVLAFDGPSGLNFLHRPILAELGVAAQDGWTIIPADADEREPAKYARMLDFIGVDGAAFQPSLRVREADRQKASTGVWNVSGEPEKTIVCFPSSGEGAVRSLDAATWARWISHLAARGPVIVLGGAADAAFIKEVMGAWVPAGVSSLDVPAGDVGLLAAILERSAAYVGMDTGPMHVAAALGRPTLGVFGGGHRATRFLPVGPRAAAVRMPIGCYGCDWFCPFDRRLCIKRIPTDVLLAAGDAFLDDAQRDNASPLATRVFELSAPPDLPAEVLGPVMRQHRQFLKLNHETIAHHDYLARVLAAQDARVEELSTALADAGMTVDALARQNHERGEAIARFSLALAEMTQQNTARDQAIARTLDCLAEMTQQNVGRDVAISANAGTLAAMTLQNQQRDEAIAAAGQTLAAMTEQNVARDQAIAHINETLAAMTRQNAARDQAIAELDQRTSQRVGEHLQ